MICLFPNCAFISETSRVIEIYRALRRRRCEAVVATHGGPYEVLLRREQVPYTRLEPRFDDERAERFLSVNRMESLFAEFYELAELREHVAREIEWFRERRVRLVHGGFTLSNSISARAVGARYSVAHGMVPLILERGLQPWPDELDCWLSRLIPDRFKEGFINWAMLRSSRFAGPFNRVAREYGVTPFKSFLEVMLGDFTYVTDTPEVLGIDARDFESWKAAPSLYSRPMACRAVGPIFARLSGEVPDSVKELAGSGAKSIYVALTSTKREYLDAVHHALKDMDARLIFSTNVHSDAVQQSDRVRVFDYLPSHKVMPLVDLAIIHGGQGSVQTAIASGVPVVGFPLQAEQKFNLRLLEARGAGICMPVKELLAGGLAPAVKRVLGDSSFRQRALELKEAQARYDGADAVAEDLARISARAGLSDEPRSV